MRIPSYALALVVVAGSVALVSATRNTRFSAHDLAYYAPQATVEYVNPGLVFTVVSAKMASDGTISMDYKATDPQGLPLDSYRHPDSRRHQSPIPVGVHSQRPGTICLVELARVTAVSGGATATEAAGDSGGTLTTVAVGENIYTFNTKAPAGFLPHPPPTGWASTGRAT